MFDHVKSARFPAASSVFTVNNSSSFGFLQIKKGIAIFRYKTNIATKVGNVKLYYMLFVEDGDSG
jgi:hypothetical protein